MKSTVVVGYDQTPPSDLALAEAAAEAARRGAALSVVTAYHTLPAAAPGVESPAAEQAAQKAAEQIADHGAATAREQEPGVEVHSQVIAGYAGKVLAAAGHGADLLVVGHRGRGGFSELQLGSVSMRALAGACSPVLVVRGDRHAPHDRVVVAVDVDEPCDAVLDFGFAEAARRGAKVTVMHVWDEPWILAYGQEDPGIADDIALIEGERMDRLGDVVRAAQARHPELQTFQQVATGSAAGLLVEATKRADLLVVGARRHIVGRHGLQIGPVAQTLLHHAECPVAVVPLG